MLAEIAPEQLSQELDQIAEQTLRRAQLTAPPVDAFFLAERLGLQIAWDATQSSRGRYVRLRAGDSLGGHPTIVLRPDPRPEREQWAAAHEIGEHLAVEVFHRLGVDPREAAPNGREQVACWLASRLLLPSGWFGSHARACNWDLLLLKRRFSTASHELIARRMLDFEPAVIITIVDHGQVTFRQSNVVARAGNWLAGEHSCWAAVHRDGKPAEHRGELFQTRVWPVHEPGWKREIVRTELQWEYAQCAEYY